MKHFSLLFLFAILPVCAQNYQPLTAEERFRWFGKVTYGPRSLLISGPVTSAWRTYTNRPDEWGPGWEGFGKRYGMRLVNNSVTNGLENSAGAIWKEDPRYFRLGQGPLRHRVRHAFMRTWMSRYGDGEYRFGAAKAIGLVGGAFAQKMWMPDSVTSNRDCLIRIGGGYSSRFLSNIVREFGPEIRKLMKRNKN
jgi:hypothetical protein